MIDKWYGVRDKREVEYEGDFLLPKGDAKDDGPSSESVWISCPKDGGSS